MGYLAKAFQLSLSPESHLQNSSRSVGSTFSGKYFGPSFPLIPEWPEIRIKDNLLFQSASMNFDEIHITLRH